MRANTRFLAPKLFYGCWYAAIGALIPFISLYYRQAGLDIARIGLLAASSGIILIIAAPLWGVLADALRLHRLMLPLAAIGTVVPVLLISRSTSFGVLVFLTLVQSFFLAPVGALADNATLTLLGAQRDRYGAQRVWGSVGWALSTLVFGQLNARWGYTSNFVGYAVLACLAGAAASLLPSSTIVAVDLRASARLLLRDKYWLGFLGCAFLLGYCGATVSSFLSLYLQDLGAHSDQIGLAYTIASVSELPVMWLSPLVLRRWGARPLLITAAFCYALRMAIYAVAPTAGWVLAGQALHGLCFAALWTAGVVEVQRRTPPGFEATGQTLFGLAAVGVASASASALGGALYHDYGSVVLFSCACGAALLSGMVLVAGLTDRPIGNK